MAFYWKRHNFIKITLISLKWRDCRNLKKLSYRFYKNIRFYENIRFYKNICKQEIAEILKNFLTVFRTKFVFYKNISFFNKFVFIKNYFVKTKSFKVSLVLIKNNK